MPSKPVDAMKPEVVAKEMHEAIERARRGDGPTFWSYVPSISRTPMSDAQHYRTKEEVKLKQEEDPISHVLHVIYENEWATEDEIKVITIGYANEWRNEKFAEESHIQKQT